MPQQHDPEDMHGHMIDEEAVGDRNENQKALEHHMSGDNYNQLNNQLCNNGSSGKSNELIIRPIEGRQTNFYYIKEQGGKIGRHSVNEVVIYDESVSRHHAEITFEANEFYLQDIGSTTGTYIKIEERLPLENDMILEIGSYQFRVKNLYITKKNTNMVRNFL